MNFTSFAKNELRPDIFYDVKDQLKYHIYGRSNKAFLSGDRIRDAIKTKKDLQLRQKLVHQKFIGCVGGLPKGGPLNARTVGVIEEDGFRIEKIIFESRPNNFVTANLYMPNNRCEPCGAVLFLCGHHNAGKQAPPYQVVCRYLVKAGLAVLAQDPIGQGERVAYYEKSIGKSTVDFCTWEHSYTGAQCLPLGDGIARYFLHDAMRGIDYLRSRPEVDDDKIGVTGSSGGGTQASMMMMCDPRIAAAAPGTFIMNRQTYMYAGGAQDAEQIWPGMTAWGWDHEDILISMVPRPVCVLGVTYDAFPIEGTRRTVERSRRFWEMYDKPDYIKLFEDVSVHMYTRNLACCAAEFFSEHLNGNKNSVADDEVEPIEPSLLWCTKSGQVQGEIKGARFVYEENLDRLNAVEKKRKLSKPAARKTKAINWLKKKVFANRNICDLNLRVYLTEQIPGLIVEFGLWWSQEGIFNNAVIFKDVTCDTKQIPVTIALWDGGTKNITDHIAWIRMKCNSGRAVMVLDVTGVGGVEPNNLVGSFPLNGLYGAIHKFSDDLFWLDDSLAAMRTYDIIRALDVIEQWPGLTIKGLECYTIEECGVYMQLAKILDKRIKKLEVLNGMGCYVDWIRQRYYNYSNLPSLIIPGMLKYFDLSDIEKW